MFKWKMAKFYKILETFTYKSGNMDEDYTAAQVWLKDRSFGPFINGKMILKGDSDVHHVTNPWTGSPLTTVRTASSKDIDRAITSAIGAYGVIQEFNTGKVYKFMVEIAGLLERHAHLFAQVDSLNRGVLVSTPRLFDVPAMVNQFKFYANVAYDPSGENGNGKLEPLTVGIMTKDTPLIALAWLLAPVFALKRVVILVVPKETALPAMLFAQVCIEASGFDGIFNILPGDDTTVKNIVSHSSIHNVRFFGPTTIARDLKQLTAGECKLSTSLMTGKTQMLVFDSADLSAAVDCAVKSASLYQGVVPWAVKTLIVQDSIFKEFVTMLKAHVDSLRFGPPCKKQVEVGPTCESGIKEAIAKVVEAARASGLEVFQGTLPEGLCPDRYIPPTILIGGKLYSNDEIPNKDQLPVISVVPFRTPKEAIALANNACYSLSASVWCENLSLSLTVAESLKVGTVWLNTHSVFDPAVPFGGWKQSGLGSFGGFSGLQDTLMKTKFVTKPNVVSTLCLSGPRAKGYKLYYSGAYYASKVNEPLVFEKNEKQFATMAITCSQDMNVAVRGALAAQERWSQLSPLLKAKTMHNMAERLVVERQRLGSLCTSAEDLYAVIDSVIEEIHKWSSTCAMKVASYVYPSVKNVTVRISREALGIIGLSLRKDQVVSLLTTITAAICLDNAVLVLLEAEAALMPLLEIFIAMLDVVPSGLINIMTGDVPAMMKMLTLNPAVDGIWFPDCTPEVAAMIEANSAADMKRVYVDCGVLLRQQFLMMRLTQSKAIWMSKGCGLC